jgi:hypothetical protein
LKPTGLRHGTPPEDTKLTDHSASVSPAESMLHARDPVNQAFAQDFYLLIKNKSAL